MKENKTFIATPITEEQKQKIRAIKDIVAQKHEYADWHQIDMTDREPWERNEIMLSMMEEILEIALIEQPLPSSENKNSMRNFIHDTNSALGRIQRSCDFIAQWLKDNAVKSVSAGINASKPYISLEYIKTAKKDIQNSIDLLYSQLQTTSPSFPSDEEIEKKLLQLFGFLNADIQAIDAKNQLKIQEFMKWLSNYKEQTKNKGGKE